MNSAGKKASLLRVAKQLEALHLVVADIESGGVMDEKSCSTVFDNLYRARLAVGAMLYNLGDPSYIIYDPPTQESLWKEIDMKAITLTQPWATLVAIKTNRKVWQA